MFLSTFSMIFMILKITPRIQATAPHKVAVPIGGAAHFTCNTETIAIWTKEEKNGAVNSIAAGEVALPGVDSSRFSFSRKGNDFSIKIKDIQPSDSGKFICNNVNEYHLIVVETPRCLPSVNALKEDEHFRFSCESSVHQFEREKVGKIDWIFGGVDLRSGVEEEEEGASASAIRSVVSYTAKYLDHGKELRCLVRHPHWDADFQAPSCSFGDFNVQFQPKISCPSEKLFLPGENPFLLKCTIVGNPLPNVGDVKWIFEKRNDERRKFPSFTLKEDSIEATLKLTTHHLSVRNSNVNVTLRIPNKVAGGPKFVAKSIVARFVHGPDISCNKNLVVDETKRKRQGKDKMTKIQCDVHVNPVPPTSNISWYVDDDFIQRQRMELLKEIPNGIRVGMELDPDQYGKDALKVTLKISGLIAAKGEIIQVTIPHMQSDENNPRRERGNEKESFISSNDGLLMLGGGTFFLMILTVVVAIVFYKKGFFSSNESQYGTRAVIAQGTMADSEFFGIADKGYDSGTFQFYQPKNTLDPHGTMTMKLMKRIKESERDSEWTEGFAKMANALYLKDTDQDGYLTVMEAKPVVLSYSDIYHLGITENKLDEVFTQCSNGQHVDVETLLRMISLPATA